ncbi:MAG: hypothetical protein ABEJ07_06115 [Candidatus Nanohaloarchaea archaeon]
MPKGFDVYKSRMEDWELLERKQAFAERGVPVEIDYGRDFAYVAFPTSYSDQVNGEVEDMRLVRENADEAFVTSWLNLRERELARLNGEFDAVEALEASAD